jgi:hypothetical protein
MMYYSSFCKAADGGAPSNAYGHKERCLDAFLDYAETEAEELDRWIWPSLLGSRSYNCVRNDGWTIEDRVF